MAREIFNPNFSLFVQVPEHGTTFQPNANSVVQNDEARGTNHLDFFKFVGRIIGKALYDGQLIDAFFTRSFYKHMLGDPLTYEVSTYTSCALLGCSITLSDVLGCIVAIQCANSMWIHALILQWDFKLQYLQLMPPHACEAAHGDFHAHTPIWAAHCQCIKERWRISANSTPAVHEHRTLRRWILSTTRT